jgi:hypothetical protein
MKRIPTRLKSNGLHVWDKPGLSSCLVYHVYLVLPDETDRIDQTDRTDQMNKTG